MGWVSGFLVLVCIWLDRVEGWQKFIYHNLLGGLYFLHMLGGQRLYNLLCIDWLLDCILPSIATLRDELFTRGLLVSFGVVFSAWVSQVGHLTSNL